MSLIEETPGSKKPSVNQPRYWCLDCKGVADAECQEEHTLRRLHLVRKSQMTPTMELLERAISTQHRLVEELEPVAASLSSYMTRQIAEIKEARAGAEKTLTRLSQGLDLVGSEWDAVEAAAEQARQSSNHRLAEDELSLQLLSLGGHCQVRLATTGGEAWRADVNLDGDVEGVADVRGLLVNMQRTGILHLVKNEVPDSQKNRLNDTQAVNSARLSAVQDTAMPASMQELSLAVTGERTTEKIATLQRDHTNVLCLRILRCDHDPAWACALIRKLRPTLEDLSAEGLRFEHLVAVQGMKQLRSLSIKYYQQCGLAGSHTPRKPRLLEELKLNVPLCDVWCWIRSFPPKALRLDLPDTVTLLDPDFVKTRYAMRSIRSCEDVTLEREVPYHGRATHASLCEEQRLAFVEDGCTVTRCSGCHEETRLA